MVTLASMLYTVAYGSAVCKAAHYRPQWLSSNASPGQQHCSTEMSLVSGRSVEVSHYGSAVHYISACIDTKFVLGRFCNYLHLIAVAERIFFLLLFFFPPVHVVVVLGLWTAL